MKGRPPDLARNYGAQYEDECVASSYHLRPPNPSETYDILVGLMPPGPRVVLDLGCGTGEVALNLKGRADRIDAVDPSAAMLRVARGRPGADDSTIRWIRSTAEDFDYPGPYSLVIAADSLKWLDWDIVMPRIGDALMPGCFLAVVNGRELVDVPWASELRALIPIYSTNQDYRPLDVIQELVGRGLFREVGCRATSRVPYRQAVEDYIESIHTRNGFSRQRMNPKAMAEFDQAVARMVMPHAHDGLYDGEIQSEVIWGVPMAGISLGVL